MGIPSAKTQRSSRTREPAEYQVVRLRPPPRDPPLLAGALQGIRHGVSVTAVMCAVHRTLGRSTIDSNNTDQSCWISLKLDQLEISLGSTANLSEQGGESRSNAAKTLTTRLHIYRTHR